MYYNIILLNFLKEALFLYKKKCCESYVTNNMLLITNKK